MPFYNFDTSQITTQPSPFAVCHLPMFSMMAALVLHDPPEIGLQPTRWVPIHSLRNTAIYTYLGVSPIELSGTYFMSRIALLVKLILTNYICMHLQLDIIVVLKEKRWCIHVLEQVPSQKSIPSQVRENEECSYKILLPPVTFVKYLKIFKNNILPN